jgi:predicted outer membrane protein
MPAFALPPWRHQRDERGHLNRDETAESKLHPNAAGVILPNIMAHPNAIPIILRQNCGGICISPRMINQTDSNRREFLKKSAATTLALGVGVSLLGSSTAARAAEEDNVSMPGMVKPVPNEELFRKGVIGPAELSLVTSKIAIDKATDAQTKEFAGFELTEAIAVTTVLKELGTPVPEMGDMAKQTLESLKAAPKGIEFDKAYMTAQLQNHVFLRNHATDYLKNSTGKTDPAETQTRHLATLALATFKEHVALCQRISAQLKES